jgi:hypothetical protein
MSIAHRENNQYADIARLLPKPHVLVQCLCILADRAVRLGSVCDRQADRNVQLARATRQPVLRFELAEQAIDLLVRRWRKKVRVVAHVPAAAADGVFPSVEQPAGR